jgi:hypothetical protein
LKPRGITPWPSLTRIGWTLASVGVLSGIIYLFVAFAGRVIDRAGYPPGAGVAAVLEVIVLLLGLLATFVYGVSIPDALIERHAPRRERNRVYALLWIASVVLNLSVFVVVGVVSVVIHRVL